MFGFTSVVSILFSESLCPFLCQNNAVFITVALENFLKSGMVMHPALFFSLSMVLEIVGLSWIQKSVMITCSTSVKNVIGIALNLKIALGSMIILTILVLSIQE